MNHVHGYAELSVQILKVDFLAEKFAFRFIAAIWVVLERLNWEMGAGPPLI
jgi:hypothetical protein